MSTNDRSGPSERHAGKNPVKRQGNTDLRIRRTRQRLGAALIALIEEKAIHEVTVREVLDRAKVGRSTFYVHYQDKDDLFLSQLEEGLQMWSNILSTKHEKSRRVAPVMEFFAHVASARKLYRSLVASGRIQDFFDLAQGYFARGIARRLKEIGLPIPDQREFDARAHALTGTLLSLLKMVA
jgi:AcrR family transcriptional regulator